MIRIASGWNSPILPGRLFATKLALLLAAKAVSPDALKNIDKDRPDSGYDARELERGIKVEMEHTHDADIAKIIAKDHLDEFPDYYERLDEMESKAKEEGAGEPE